MATDVQSVKHDHGITREIYDTTRTYGETIARLRDVGTVEDSISEDFYRAAVRMYATTVVDTIALDQMAPADRRMALITLATLTLRWARKVRIGTPPGAPDPLWTEGELPYDT